MTLVVAVTTGLVAALLLPTPSVLQDVAHTGSGHVPVPLVVLVAAAVVGVAVLHGRQLALAGIALLVLVAVKALLARERAARAADVSAGRVMEFCESVAAELVAGQPPHRVLERSGEEFPEFSGVATAARLGSDVPDALRRLATLPGCGDLRLVAAAWQVAHRSGSGLAAALEQVGRTIRERRRTSRLVAAELAAARATARMMAALPLLFAVAGSGLGVDPLAFLTGTAAGVACLAAGLGLSWAGLAWLQRIADAVTG